MAQDILVRLIGPNSTAVLIKTLDDPDERVQLNALRQLRSLPTNDAVNLLLDKMLMEAVHPFGFLHLMSLKIQSIRRKL